MEYPEVEKNENIVVNYLETLESLELKPHFHNSYEIIFILEGAVEFSTNGKIYVAKEGSAIFISNLESHELKVVQYPYKRYFLLLRPSYFQAVLNSPQLVSIFKNRPRHFNHVLNLNNYAFGLMKTYIEQLSREICEKQSFWELSAAALLSMLFTFLYRNYTSLFPITAMTGSMELILNIQKHIDEHIMEELNLKEIAGLFFTDMYYLSHLYKKVTGFNFKEYIILQRLSRAKELLNLTTENITAVACLSGFNNVNHFIRIFKKYERITPYQYRKRYKV